MEELGKNFVFLASSQIITILGGFAINIFLARTLGKELYGLYSFVIVGVIVVGQNLVANGFSQTLSKNLSEERFNIKEITSIMLFYQIIESVVIVLIYIGVSPLLSIIFKDNRLIKLVSLASLIVFSQGMISFLVGFYNGLRKFKIQSILVSLIAIVKTVLIILLVVLLGIEGAIIGFFSSLLLISIVFFIQSRKYYTLKIKLVLPKDIWKYFIRITLFSIELSIFLSLDLNALKLFLANNQDAGVGIYNAGAVVAKTCYYIVIAFSGVMFPIIANLFSKNMIEDAKKQIGKMIKISSISLVPITLIIASFSTPIINLLYSSEYSSASTISAILAFGYSLIGYFFIFSNILNSIGEVRKTNIISVIIILMGFALQFFLIREFEIVGAAIATLITSFLGCTTIFILVIKKIGIIIEKKAIIRINLIGFFLFGITNFIIVRFIQNIIILFAILVIEGLFYLISLKLSGDLNIISLLKEGLSKPND
ncbi:MAG: oligosaccharide flippase family protein [Candidatus Helarchaeota archaeon]